MNVKIIKICKNINTILFKIYYVPKPISSSDSGSGSSFFFSSLAGALSVLAGATAAGALKKNNFIIYIVMYILYKIQCDIWSKKQ